MFYKTQTHHFLKPCNRVCFSFTKEIHCSKQHEPLQSLDLLLPVIKYLLYRDFCFSVESLTKESQKHKPNIYQRRFHVLLVLMHAQTPLLDPNHLCSLSVGFERGGISQVGNLKVLYHKVFLLLGWMWSVGAAIDRCDIDGWSV